MDVLLFSSGSQTLASTAKGYRDRGRDPSKEMSDST
jgi:hypothetical protein